MVDISGNKTGPLVSVLLPTFNRRQTLPVALSSVLRQQYDNLEVLVIRDGGAEVADIVGSFGDPRIVFIDRQENRGKACSLNEAMQSANGKYIAYIDDDDLYYPNHVSILVDCLERHADCQMAYSDLYRTYCRVEPDGGRETLSKVLEVSRDFDRFVMLYFNHILHVSLMHRRDLIEKTGPYNEDLKVLIDWDFTRKASFFTDSYHTCEVTGEYFSPVGDSDRLSVVRRRDKDEYLWNVLQIRTSRPPKPWPKMDDASIILETDAFDQRAKETLLSIWRHTFYPYKVYLPLSRAEVAELETEMPNIVPVAIDEPQKSRVDAALAACEGEYTAVVPAGFPIRELWLEESLYPLVTSPADHRAFELEDSTDMLWAVVVRTDDLRKARACYPKLSICECLKACNVAVGRVSPEDIPFQFDQSLAQARLAGEQNNWLRAAGILEYAAENYGNNLWLKSLAAEAFFKAEQFEKSAQICRQVNFDRPVVDTLLLEARVNKRMNNADAAIDLLERANHILEGMEPAWT